MKHVPTIHKLSEIMLRIFVNYITFPESVLANVVCSVYCILLYVIM